MTFPLLAAVLIGIALAETLDDAAGRFMIYDKLGWSVSVQNTAVYILYALFAMLAYPVVSRIL